MPLQVRCFRVVIHGAFQPRLNLGSDVSARGFYTTRWVVTPDEQAAVGKAFNSARGELARGHPDIRDGLVTIDMEAEEVAPGSWWCWLKNGSRGFSFYSDG